MEEKIEIKDIEINSNQSRVSAETKVEADPIQKEKEKKKSWEEFLGRKLVDPKEYEKLKKSEKIFKLIKYIGIGIFLLIFLLLLMWFIVEFSDKNFYQGIEVFNNNTNNIPPQENNINISNNPTIPVYLNVTMNIDKILVNYTGGA